VKTPFVPDTLPLASIDWVRFISLIGQANAEIARYDGILQSIPNPKVLLSPLTTNEAVLSSKIEGTQASLEEVLAFEASPDIKNEKYHDIQEILNYRSAMNHAVKWIDKKPITLNLIKEIHGILLDSVRGKDKARGEFRKGQNYIGKPGSKIEDAMYIPPDPLLLMDHLYNFEKYIHYDEKDRLVQLAIIHAQFEIIHPFLDGNGRLGRILMPLFLFEKKVLQSPMFYISEYFEKNRSEYYAHLRAISDERDWNSWIEFFLKAVVEQAKINSAKAREILNLYELKKEKVVEATHSEYSIKTLDTLFKKPVFTTADFVKISGIPLATAKRILSKLKEKKIISSIEAGSGRKGELFIFNKLLKIVG
jgi:Fic family protein